MSLVTHSILGLVLAAASAAAQVTGPVTPVAARDSVAVPAAGDSSRVPAFRDSAGRAVDYLWVLRSQMVDQASVDSMVARAVAMGVRGVLVQVVGRGDAFYRSDLLPRAEALARAPKEFDPLAQVLTGARPAGLEVHAWMNCMLVWSAPHWPRDPRHVLNQHPEWVTGLEDGRLMTQLSDRERRAMAVEGVFLTPAHPRVRAWVAGIAAEIASRYQVDGIHLDYIRQPGVAVGYDQTTRARFAMETGIDPERFPTLAPAHRAAMNAAWAAFQREQVTRVVLDVRDSLEAVRSGVTLSAAVIADTITAERANAQYWRDWVRNGVVDRVYPMCYAASVQTVMNQLAALSRELGASDRVVPGIAVFNTSTATAAHKITGARVLGFPLVALYSYDALFEKSPGWASLRDKLQPPDRRSLGRTP